MSPRKERICEKEKKEEIDGNKERRKRNKEKEEEKGREREGSTNCFSCLGKSTLPCVLFFFFTMIEPPPPWSNHRHLCGNGCVWVCALVISSSTPCFDRY